MAKDLNERTYESGFIASIASSPQIRLKNAPCHLTGIDEEKYGYDVELNLEKPGIPIFLQFKVPKKIKQRKVHEITNSFGPDASCIRFCMPIRANKKFRQHYKLIETESDNAPCLVFYSTPKYSTSDEHDNAFANRSVHQLSVYFSPTEIGRIKSLNSCKIGYFTNSNNAVLCSYRKRLIVDTSIVRAHTFHQMIDSAHEKLCANDNSLGENIDIVFEHTLGRNAAVKTKKMMLPRAPSRGTMSFVVANYREVIVRRGESDYYPSKIRMLAKAAREKMGARLFILYSGVAT